MGCHVTELSVVVVAVVVIVVVDSLNLKREVTNYYTHLLSEDAHKECMALLGFLDFNKLFT